MDKFEPNWDEAPEWANYWAVDDDGEMFWYEELPLLDETIWTDSDLSGGEVQFAGYCEESFDYTVLHKRPVEMKAPFETKETDSLSNWESTEQPSAASILKAGLGHMEDRPNTLFEDLKESLEEALEIKEGTREPSRVTTVEAKDSINPSHYKNGKVECIDAIESATVGKTGLEAVCTANVTKYLWRYETKNGLEDVKKAQWYLNRLVEHLESKES